MYHPTASKASQFSCTIILQEKGHSWAPSQGFKSAPHNYLNEVNPTIAELKEWKVIFLKVYTQYSHF